MKKLNRKNKYRTDRKSGKRKKVKVGIEKLMNNAVAKAKVIKEQ